MLLKRGLSLLQFAFSNQEMILDRSVFVRKVCPVMPGWLHAVGEARCTGRCIG